MFNWVNLSWTSWHFQRICHKCNAVEGFVLCINIEKTGGIIFLRCEKLSSVVCEDFSRRYDGLDMSLHSSLGRLLPCADFERLEDRARLLRGGYRYATA